MVFDVKMQVTLGGAGGRALRRGIRYLVSKSNGAGLFHIPCKLGDKGLEFNLGRFRFPTGIDFVHQGDI